MGNRDIVVAILGLQITILFGIMSLVGQIGTVFWEEVFYMAIGVVVTASAIVFPRYEREDVDAG